MVSSNGSRSMVSNWFPAVDHAHANRRHRRRRCRRQQRTTATTMMDSHCRPDAAKSTREDLSERTTTESWRLTSSLLVYTMATTLSLLLLLALPSGTLAETTTSPTEEAAGVTVPQTHTEPADNVSNSSVAETQSIAATVLNSGNADDVRDTSTPDGGLVVAEPTKQSHTPPSIDTRSSTVGEVTVAEKLSVPTSTSTTVAVDRGAERGQQPTAAASGSADHNQDIDNEIYAALDDGILKEVKKSPDFVLSDAEPSRKAGEKSTENLEQTIRISVKTEIELEQNTGAATIIDAFRDIPEPEVRQKLTEEILAQKNTDDAEDSQADVVQQQQQKVIIINDDAPAPTTTIAEADREAVASPDSAEVGSVNRDGRNLAATPEDAARSAQFNEQPSSANPSRDIEEALNTKPDLSPAPSESLTSGGGAAGVGQTASNAPPTSVTDNSLEETENEENTIDSLVDGQRLPAGDPAITDVISALQTETHAINAILTPTPSEKTASQPDKIDESTPPTEDHLQEIERDGQSVLSVVLNETIGESDRATAQLESLESVEGSADEGTTLPPFEVHNVIKKPGVDLTEQFVDEPEIDSSEEDAAKNTTVRSRPGDATNDQNINPIMLNPTNGSVNASADTNLPVDNGENVDETAEQQTKDPPANSDPEPDSEVQSQLETHKEPQTVAVSQPAAEPPLTTELQPAPGQEATGTDHSEEKSSGSESIGTSTEVATDEPQSTIAPDAEDDALLMPSGYSTEVTNGEVPAKDLRSVSEESAATLLDAFIPQDVDRLFDNSVAAESSKLLPTRSVADKIAKATPSALIIALCSGTAVIFIVVALLIFLISFQRQHGTLDIEMQEQRLGKDNLDENDDDDDDDEETATCTKLLDVELPPPSTSIVIEEAEECL